MKHVTLGTAGHVDHGKTTLVRYLTGVDTDRLPEEKRRGLTIELGFAALDLPNGERVSIVDVPGHERFVKNMVAGVTGIDMALLVVAADEGIMPQTAEHLDILHLLQVRRGVVAVTKADLVEADWLELVVEEIRERISQTTLAQMKIIPVSSITGAGVSELLQEIQRLAGEVGRSTEGAVFRMPVDRVFTIAGHGTIVTGTIAGGAIDVDDSVVVLPHNLQGRIRSLQLHGKPCSRAVAGDRCAINLAGIGKEQIERGHVIARPETIPVSKILDVALTALPDGTGIRHGRRLRVLSGASEVLGQVRLLGQEEIGPSHSGYGQLRLESPIPIIRGDLFILREMSPVVTIGGGRFLAVSPRGRKRFDPGDLLAVETEDTGSDTDRILLYLKERNPNRGRPVQLMISPPIEVNELEQGTFMEEELLAAAIDNLVATCKVIKVGEPIRLLLSEDYGVIREAVQRVIAQTLADNPLRLGVEREEVHSRLLPAWDAKEYGALVQLMQDEGVFSQQRTLLVLPSTEGRDTLLADADVQRVLTAIRQAGLAASKVEELRLKLSGRYRMEDIVTFLAGVGEIIPVSDGAYVSKAVFDAAQTIAVEILSRSGQLTVAEYRDALGTGRKMALAVLEVLDQFGITRRQDDVRVPGPKINNTMA